jgi:hypothetical protein
LQLFEENMPIWIYQLCQDEDLFCCWSVSPSANLNDGDEYVIDGRYNFYWRTFPRDDYAQGNSYLTIEDGMLKSLMAQPNTGITLEMAISILGEPDYLRFSPHIYDTGITELIYSETRLRVSFFTISGEGCRTTNFGKRFLLSAVFYFSPEAAANSADRPLYPGDQEPLLTARCYKGEPDVPPEIWRSWLNNEVDLSCTDASQQVLDAVEAN